MGFIENAKETAETAGRKIKEGFDDAADRIGDKVDELKADADVKKAEADRDAVKARNDVKSHLRDD